MEHDAICEECGKLTPCLEEDCNDPALHPYICEDCLEAEKKKPYHSYMDTIESDVRFGD